ATIGGMSLVSTPGTWNAVYGPLDHAAWNGWTLTDLVFPFLLFAMGAAVPFALERRRGAPRVPGVRLQPDQRRIRRHVVRRATILFLLGLLLNAIAAAPPLDLGTFRIPGVLQRIAIVYAVVAVITERLSWRAQIAAAIAILVGYWALLTLVPVPGFGRGVLTPQGNLASYLDRLVLGRHLLARTHDPEGLLSTLPAIATALCGVFAGTWLKERRVRNRTAWLWTAGGAATAAGLLWDRVFPINKNLWTGSFVLLSGGLAAQALALCHWLVDTLRVGASSRPFTAYGRNPLAAYFLSVGFDAVLTRWRIAE